MEVELVTVHHRHLNVRDHNVELFAAFEELQCVDRTVDGLDFVRLRLQRRGDEFAEEDGVVDDQNSLLLVGVRALEPVGIRLQELLMRYT